MEIRGPTVDELAELFTAVCPLHIARRRDFKIWLSADHRSIECDDSTPVGFYRALALNQDVPRHKQNGFLRGWCSPEGEA